MKAAKLVLYFDKKSCYPRVDYVIYYDNLLDLTFRVYSYIRDNQSELQRYEILL